MKEMEHKLKDGEKKSSIPPIKLVLELFSNLENLAANNPFHYSYLFNGSPQYIYIYKEFKGFVIKNFEEK